MHTSNRNIEAPTQMGDNFAREIQAPGNAARINALQQQRIWTYGKSEVQGKQEEPAYVNCVIYSATVGAAHITLHVRRHVSLNSSD